MPEYKTAEDFNAAYSKATQQAIGQAEEHGITDPQEIARMILVARSQVTKLDEPPRTYANVKADDPVAIERHPDIQRHQDELRERHMRRHAAIMDFVASGGDRQQRAE